jgi:hypothetical protein
MEDMWPFLERDEFRENMLVPVLEEQWSWSSQRL